MGGRERTWAARQRHLLQAQYADARLGEVLDQLEASDRFDSSLIVVTADHGSGFVAGEPSRSLTERNAPHVARVPLLVKSLAWCAAARTARRSRWW